MRSFRATEKIWVFGSHREYNDGRTITVRAESYEEAAQHAINRLVSRRAFAQRTTGEPGMSGWFQGYRSCPTGGSTSTGYAIHVREQ